MRKLNSLFDRLRKRTKADKGFTLIELVIVVAVIGILTAIAVPSYLNTQATARENTVKAAATDGYTAMQSYFAAGDNYNVAKAKLIKLNPTTTSNSAVYYTVTGNAPDHLFVQANIGSDPTKPPFAIRSYIRGLEFTKE